MKKIIGILGVAVIAVAMFFSVNNVNSSSSDIGLVSLMNINVANAQDSESNNWGGAAGGFISDITGGVQSSTTCTAAIADGTEWDPFSQSYVPKWKYVDGHNYDCDGWSTSSCKYTLGCRSDA